MRRFIRKRGTVEEGRRGYCFFLLFSFSPLPLFRPLIGSLYSPINKVNRPYPAWYDSFVAVHIFEADAVHIDFNEVNSLQVLMTVFVVEDKR